MNSYGPKGNAIIQSMLLRFFDLNTTPKTSFSPLTPKQLTECFLVPYVACRLIEQDLKCSFSDAHDVMVASSNNGTTLQPENDNDKELDDILKKIFCEMRKERLKRLDTPQSPAEQSNQLLYS
jgi:hypothetical protein